MVSNRRLYYFTGSFPYGIGEQWKFQELEVLKRYFKEIIVVPYTYGGNSTTPRKLSPEIVVLDPLFPDEPCGISLRRFLKVLLLHPGIIFSELITRRLFISWYRFNKALRFISNSVRILEHPTFARLMAESTTDTYWFFFWGLGLADSMAFAPKFKRKKVAVRLHRFDLFESGTYHPFRNALFQQCDLILPISGLGKQYLKENYKVGDKVFVSRLGTKSAGLASPSNDGVFRVVSCSTVSALKRVHLIALALRHMDKIQVHWTHLGDGPLLKEVKSIVDDLPGNIQVELVGHVSASEVLGWLTSRPTDLFVNVSTVEGVPVSIMEAFSAGIPVLATDVGATHEIVDDTVGGLMPINIDPIEIAQHMMRFVCMPKEKVSELRRNAFKRYVEFYDMDKCAVRMIDIFFMKQ